MTVHKASPKSIRVPKSSSTSSVVHKASNLTPKSVPEFWQCVVCGRKEYYGGDSGQTFEQARRMIRRKCRTENCDPRIQLIDIAFRNWQRQQQQNIDKEAIALIRAQNIVLGRYGRFPKSNP